MDSTGTNLCQRGKSKVTWQVWSTRSGPSRLGRARVGDCYYVLMENPLMAGARFIMYVGEAGVSVCMQAWCAHVRSVDDLGCWSLGLFHLFLKYVIGLGLPSLLPFILVRSQSASHSPFGSPESGHIPIAILLCIES